MRPNILVAGDAIIDRYLHGRVERVNPEAPGLVFGVDRTEDRPGGSAAVAMLCEALGAKVELLAGEPRSIKQRCVANERLLYDRIDFDVRAAPVTINPRGQPQAIVVADYGKGAIHAGTVDQLHRLWPDVPLLVDPARGRPWSRYYAGARLIKCNRFEYAEECNRSGGRRFFRETVVTHGSEGLDCSLFGAAPTHFAARPSKLVDVTGAGDTVMAVLAVCLARGYDLRRACELANVAGGLQVERLGVAPITWEEIRAGSRSTGSRTLVTLAELLPLVERYQSSGRRVVFTNGVFDLLHAGHVRLLSQAKTACGVGWERAVLIVAINSDAGVARLKGPGRPVIGELDRAETVGALSGVDHVLLFDDDTPERLITAIKPDLLVKGADYRVRKVIGRSFVESYGGRVVLVDLLPDRSTTGTIEKIRDNGTAIAKLVKHA